jgi:hypothetical protein
VPEDLEIEGDEERFTIEVSYDTLDLYGEITATREIVVLSEREEESG